MREINQRLTLVSWYSSVFSSLSDYSRSTPQFLLALSHRVFHQPVSIKLFSNPVRVTPSSRIHIASAPIPWQMLPSTLSPSLLFPLLFLPLPSSDWTLSIREGKPEQHWHCNSPVIGGGIFLLANWAGKEHAGRVILRAQQQTRTVRYTATGDTTSMRRKTLQSSSTRQKATLLRVSRKLDSHFSFPSEQSYPLVLNPLLVCSAWKCHPMELNWLCIR